eukprot:353445-Chlamydomonas_euryale.AAC.24
MVFRCPHECDANAWYRHIQSQSVEHLHTTPGTFLHRLSNALSPHPAVPTKERATPCVAVCGTVRAGSSRRQYLPRRHQQLQLHPGCGTLVPRRVGLRRIARARAADPHRTRPGAVRGHDNIGDSGEHGRRAGAGDDAAARPRL